MITQTGQYALRAMAHIATLPEECYVLARDVSKELQVPPVYLRTVLQILARKGLLNSQRGRNGGFCLARPAKKIRLYEILEAVEPVERYEACILGHKVCEDATACPIHFEWKKSRNKVLAMFRATSLNRMCENQAVIKPPGRK